MGRTMGKDKGLEGQRTGRTKDWKDKGLEGQRTGRTKDWKDKGMEGQWKGDKGMRGQRDKGQGTGGTKDWRTMENGDKGITVGGKGTKDMGQWGQKGIVG